MLWRRQVFGSGSIWGESCFAVLLCASSCSPCLSRMASGQSVERLVRLSRLDFDEVLAIDEWWALLSPHPLAEIEAAWE